MDIFGEKGLQGLDIEVFEEEAPEQAIMPEKHHNRKFGKLKAFVTAAAALCCFSAAVFASANYLSPDVYAYSVMVDGQSVALFTSYEEAAAAVDNCLADFDSQYDYKLHYAEQISVEQVSAVGQACNTSAAAIESVSNVLTPLTDACGVYIDGEYAFAVPAAADVDLILDAVKDAYSEGREEIVGIEIKQEIELQDVEVMPEEIVAVDEAYDILLNSEKALDVVLNRIVTAEEVVSYTTVKIDNPDEVRGIEKVIQEGADGLNATAYMVTEENGEIVSNQLIACNVLVPVQNYTVERGTKTVVASRYFNRNLCYEKADIEQEFIWPLHGIITDSFGAKRTTGTHTGLDIAVVLNTEVKAMEDGVVIFAANNGSYGKLIKLSHGDGVETWYAHLNKINVKLGDVVEQGDIIGLSGNTGRSSGPHLHVEVRIDTIAYNALKFLPEE